MHAEITRSLRRVDRPEPVDVPDPRRGKPVFVAGPDRSGTTLMFALLASHPDLCMVRRTNVWRYFDRRYGNLADPRNLERCLDEMVRYRRMRHLEPDPSRIRREFLAGPPTYGRLFGLFYEHHAQRLGKSRWGDKSLHTEHFADRVFAEFPQARIVHMVRDPRDRYASVRRRYGQNLSRVGGATARWLESTRAARRNAQRYPDRYLVVRYEDLVRDPTGTMQRVCEHIDVPFVPEMLTLAGLPDMREHGGNSSFGDLEPGAISVRAVGRFREVLDPAELAFIQSVASRELAALGYERVRSELDAAGVVRFYGWELPVHGARMLAWIALARLRRRYRRVPSARLEHAGDERGDAT